MSQPQVYVLFRRNVDGTRSYIKEVADCSDALIRLTTRLHEAYFWIKASDASLFNAYSVFEGTVIAIDADELRA